MRGGAHVKVTCDRTAPAPASASPVTLVPLVSLVQLVPLVLLMPIAVPPYGVSAPSVVIGCAAGYVAAVIAQARYGMGRPICARAFLICLGMMGLTIALLFHTGGCTLPALCLGFGAAPTYRGLVDHVWTAPNARWLLASFACGIGFALCGSAFSILAWPDAQPWLPAPVALPSPALRMSLLACLAALPMALLALLLHLERGWIDPRGGGEKRGPYGGGGICGSQGDAPRGDTTHGLVSKGAAGRSATAPGSMPRA